MADIIENVSLTEVLPPTQEHLQSIAESELEDAPISSLPVLKKLDTRDSIASNDSDVSLTFDQNTQKNNNTDDNQDASDSSDGNVSSPEKDSGCEVSGHEPQSEELVREQRVDEEEEPFEPPDDELANRIVAQVEFYFSDVNITKDAFLLKHVKRNKEGYVSLKLISSFKRVKHLAKDWRVVAYALQRSTKLEINEAKTKLRRVDPLPAYDQTTPSRTIVAINLPMEKPTIENVAELFRDCGEIALIRIIRPGNPIPADVRSFANKHPEMNGTVSALVEFDRTEAARLAVDRQESDWRSNAKCMKVVELNAPPSVDRKKRTQTKQKTATGKIADSGELSSSCLSSSEAEEHYLRHRRSSSPHLNRGDISRLQRRSSDLRACTCCSHCERRYSSSGSGYDSPAPAFRRYSGQEQLYQIPIRRYSGTDSPCCNAMRRCSRDSAGSESSGSYTRPHDFSRRFSRDSIVSDSGLQRRFSRDSVSSDSSGFRRLSRDSVGSDVFAPPFLSRNNSRDTIDTGRRSSFGTGQPCDHRALPHSPGRSSFSGTFGSCLSHMPENVVRMPKGPDGSKGFGVAQ